MLSIKEVLFGALGVMLLSSASAAENYPSKPINFILAMPAGSGSDGLARYYASKLEGLSGQPIIVENRPGANGAITARALMNAPADGYTLTVGSNSLMASNVAAIKDLSYDPLKDFTPIAGMVRVPNVIVVPENSPFNSLQDLIQYGKDNPGKLSFAAASASHNIATHALMQITGFEAESVPYNGPPQGLIDTTSGIVDFMLVDFPAARTLIDGNRLRMLATTLNEPLASNPTVPTMRDAGISDFEYFSWAGVFGPADLPQPIVDKLAEWTFEIVNSEDARSTFQRRGEVPYLTTAEEFKKFQEENIEWWKGVAAQAGIQPMQ